MTEESNDVVVETAPEETVQVVEATDAEATGPTDAEATDAEATDGEPAGEDAPAGALALVGAAACLPCHPSAFAKPHSAIAHLQHSECPDARFSAPSPPARAF